MKTTIPLAFAALAATGFLSSAQAATIGYVGGQSNIETLADDPAVGWRNAATAKAFDADGDNIIGTDGYDFAGSSTVASLPSYVASVSNSGGHNDKNKGLVDDPSDPAGADIGTGWNGNGSQIIVFQGSSLETKTLRLGVLYDSNWSLAYGTQTFTLTQTAGGSASATSPTVTLAGDGLDVAYFDITGIQDGDTFQLTTTAVSISWRQISGVAFDIVGGGGGSDYSTWATANGIDGELFADDFDSDGIANGVEYGLGLNPTTNSQPAGVFSGNTIT